LSWQLDSQTICTPRNKTPHPHHCRRLKVDQLVKGWIVLWDTGLSAFAHSHQSVSWIARIVLFTRLLFCPRFSQNKLYFYIEQLCWDINCCVSHTDSTACWHVTSNVSLFMYQCAALIVRCIGSSFSLFYNNYDFTLLF
jgi:hypothetical protein